MSGRPIDTTVATLLAASLPAWGLEGQARPALDGAIELNIGGRQARIEPAAEGLPFRYVLVTGDRTRGLLSITALLRAVRTLGDPDYRVAKLRLAPLPVVPP